MEDDMTKAEFLSWLTDDDVRRELASAVLTTDGIIAAPGSPKAGKNADGTDINTHWTASTYLYNGYAVNTQARTAAQALAAPLTATLAYAKAEAGEVPPAAAEVANAVLAQLAAAGRSSADVADALRAALGDRAAEVGRLLAS
jgi:hypothetical protein